MCEIADFVTRVMRDDRVWKWVCEDGIEKHQYGFSPTAKYFIMEGHGFVMFRRATQKMYEVHVCMLKGAQNVKPFVMGCLEKMRRNGVTKFIAPMGEWNKAAIRLAKSCGFVEEGRITNAHYRDGVPYAMIIMGGR